MIGPKLGSENSGVVYAGRVGGTSRFLGCFVTDCLEFENGTCIETIRHFRIEGANVFLFRPVGNRNRVFGNGRLGGRSKSEISIWSHELINYVADCAVVTLSTSVTDSG